MPAVSQQQREYLNWRFGHAWVKKHYFDNKGPLPAYVEHGKALIRKKHNKRRKRRAR